MNFEEDTVQFITHSPSEMETRSGVRLSPE